jgi:hypothetical protein
MEKKLGIAFKDQINDKLRETETFPLLGKEVALTKALTRDDYFRFENKLRDIVQELINPLYQKIADFI